MIEIWKRMNEYNSILKLELFAIFNLINDSIEEK